MGYRNLCAAIVPMLLNAASDNQAFALAHCYTSGWLSKLGADSAAAVGAALDAALAEVSAEVPLTGRQVVLTVLAEDASVRKQLAASKQCAPAQQAAHLAAAEAGFRRLLAEDPLSSRHLRALAEVLALQGQQHAAMIEASQCLQLSEKEKGRRVAQRCSCLKGVGAGADAHACAALVVGS